MPVADALASTVQPGQRLIVTKTLDCQSLPPEFFFASGSLGQFRVDDAWEILIIAAFDPPVCGPCMGAAVSTRSSEMASGTVC